MTFYFGWFELNWPICGIISDKNNYFGKHNYSSTVSLKEKVVH